MSATAKVPVMSFQLAAELDGALRRNGWDSQQVAQLSEGDTLLRVREFLFGHKSVAPAGEEVCINGDADPHIHVPSEAGYIWSHIKNGQRRWSSFCADLCEIEEREASLSGKEIQARMQRALMGERALGNANVLDFLLAHTSLIPEDWREYIVLFWGTVYTNAVGEDLVRGLYWDECTWATHYYPVHDYFGEHGVSVTVLP